jgi:hypothetical protein
VDGYPHSPSALSLQISLSLTWLGNPISELSIALQESSRSIGFYENFVISLVEEKDMFQVRAFSDKAAVGEVAKRFEGY